MASRFKIAVTLGQRPAQRNPGRGVLVTIGCALLIAGAILMLGKQIDFPRYALTGFFWTQAQGTVTDARQTSAPTIRFATPDGATHEFSEDYILLCGGRSSFCFIRNFAPGQVIPVVYDPAAPERAFVHDWALYASVINWFVEALCALLLGLMLYVFVGRKPVSLSFRRGRGAGVPD